MILKWSLSTILGLTEASRGGFVRAAFARRAALKCAQAAGDCACGTPLVAINWESFSPWTTAMRVVPLVSWVAIVLADVALVRSP